jgi:hypothetical protein
MLDMAFGICGIALIVLVWLSVVSTTLMPRRSAPRAARWATLACVAVTTRLAHYLPERTRSWVTDLSVPVSLFLLAAGWLAGLAAGFGLLVVGFGTWPEVTGVVVVFLVVAGASAVLVTAAFTAYLARFMIAHGRREGMITRTAPQVQRVTDADALVATYLRSGSREILDSYFAEWANWLADIHTSHVSLPGLMYHRSSGALSWPKAAMVVLDAAALVEAVAPRWAPLHARVLIDVGSRCLQGLAKQSGIELPAVRVSLHGREEREFGDTIQLAVDSGLPPERDIDQAWMAFQAIRVRYAPYAVVIGHRVL